MNIQFSKYISNHLNSLGYTIHCYDADIDNNSDISRLARLIADNSMECGKSLAYIRKRISGNKFDGCSLPYHEDGTAENAVFDELFKSGMLCDRRIVGKKQKRYIKFRIKQDKQTSAFLKGGWLEQYTYDVVRNVLKRFALNMHTDFELYRNLNLSLNESPGKKAYELDVVFSINNSCYVIEDKTGNQINFSQIEQKHEKLLFKPENLIFCTLGKEKKGMQSHSFVMTNPLNLEEKLTTILSNEINMGVISDDISSKHTLLQSNGLRNVQSTFSTF